jgi:hypothetical protein
MSGRSGTIPNPDNRQAQEVLTGSFRRASAWEKATSATTATMKRTMAEDSAYPNCVTNGQVRTGIALEMSMIRRLNLFLDERFRDACISVIGGRSTSCWYIVLSKVL